LWPYREPPRADGLIATRGIAPRRDDYSTFGRNPAVDLQYLRNGEFGILLTIEASGVPY